jgi:hypothetical protein
MIDKFVNFFKKKEVEKPYIEVSDDIIFNVDNFNEWFNDPNNNAVYAHSGIFLRTDKLSESHILDYIKNRFDGIKEPDHSKISEFYSKIRDDWRAKINER